MSNMPFNLQQQISPEKMLEQLKAQGSSNVIFNQLYQNNPNFRQFADEVRNMTPEQAFSRYGLDFNKFRNQRW